MSAWATSSWPRRSPTSGSSRACPSRLGYLLDLAPKDLEKIIYFAAYLITTVDDEARHRDLPTIEAEISAEKHNLENRRDADVEARQQKLEADLAELEAEGAKSDVRRKVREGGEREMRQLRDRAQREIDRLEEVLDTFRKLEVKQLIADEGLYRELRDRFGEYFEGGMGAAALQKLLADFDLDAEAVSLRETIRSGKGQRKLRALKRLKVVAAFLQTRNSPMGMVLDCVPVIPPDLRPMVQLDGGRFATSDMNDLYRRVINRNNRLKRLLDLGAPEIIVNNEKRMLQESVDALFDNGRRGRPVTGPGNRPLKSLSDLLKGKQGRFRQNLLGKRVDYSGRSVIVVGPQLKLHQCGLPKQMALELFKPFVMKRLVDLNHAQNIKSAKRMVERARPVVWDVLEEVITEHPVLLNRAPTLHRLGIQAFEPQLVEGKAIQIHPLVCTAFNADFDGDQMAVHLPLSAEAQAEARILMLSLEQHPEPGRRSSDHRADPGHGARPLPPDDPRGLARRGRRWTSRTRTPRPPRRSWRTTRACSGCRSGPGSASTRSSASTTGRSTTPWEQPEDWTPGAPARVLTSLGRVLFNEALPEDYRFVNYQVPKKELGAIVNDLAERYPKVQVAATLDALKSAGFHWATRAGHHDRHRRRRDPAGQARRSSTGTRPRPRKIEKQYERGVITDTERRGELIEIWTRARAEVSQAMVDNFPTTNPVWVMVNSGARGNMMQISQIAGMRGLVANPKGEIIPRPIKANFREGLSVLEYFISTHGARKGLADTALRTADSGLPHPSAGRRLAGRHHPRGGLRHRARRAHADRDRPRRPAVTRDPHVETGVYARALAADVVAEDGTVIAHGRRRPR